MKKEKKKILLDNLNRAIEKTKLTAEKKRATAKHFRGASRSQQGDRRYFENIADLAESNLAELLSLKAEVADSPEKTSQIAKPVCFIKIEEENGQTNQFYYVSQGTSLPNLQLLTPRSPLGQAIKGKKENESFTFQTQKDNQIIKYSGKIKKIE